MEENTRDGLGIPPTAAREGFIRGTNYFLGIGIDAYKYQRPLSNCVRDITDIKNILVEKYDFEADNTQIIENEHATRRGILKALDDMFKKVGEHDSLVFMYSGHGTNLDDRDIGFLIPVDAEDEYSYVNLSEIKTRLDSFKAKHIFVVFDSCFSGLILTQRSELRSSNIPENYPSRFALTSGRNSPVLDGDDKNSPFANAFLHTLRDNDDKLGAIALSQSILDFFSSRGKDEDQLPDFGVINDKSIYRGQYYFYPKNFQESLTHERSKRIEAEKARDDAKEMGEIERKKRQMAMIFGAITLAALLVAFSMFLGRQKALDSLTKEKNELKVTKDSLSQLLNRYDFVSDSINLQWKLNFAISLQKRGKVVLNAGYPQNAIWHFNEIDTILGDIKKEFANNPVYPYFLESINTTKQSNTQLNDKANELNIRHPTKKVTDK